MFLWKCSGRIQIFILSIKISLRPSMYSTKRKLFSILHVVNYAKSCSLRNVALENPTTLSRDKIQQQESVLLSSESNQNKTPRGRKKLPSRFCSFETSLTKLLKNQWVVPQNTDFPEFFFASSWKDCLSPLPLFSPGEVPSLSRRQKALLNLNICSLCEKRAFLGFATCTHFLWILILHQRIQARANWVEKFASRMN